jgi:hypothetical protein
VLGLAACAELFGPRAWRVALQIVPQLDTADPYAVAAAGNADSLRIRVVQAAEGGAFTDTVARATVSIDPDSGTASATLGITLLQSPQSFVIVLFAVRSSDGVVLFTGVDTVQVTATSGTGEGQEVAIPIVYTGPKATRIVLAPRDTAILGGSSFTLRAIAYDAADTVVDVPVTFFLVTPADSTRLKIAKFKGTVTSATGAEGEVRVYGQSPDSVARDTTGVRIGLVPAAVRVTPGFAAVAAGGTVQLTGQVVDQSGAAVPGTSVTSWVSRTPGVATVSGTGLVTAAGPGAAIVVGSGSGFSDSALVVVPPDADVVVSATSSGRAFRVTPVGVDTVFVDITADMRFTPSEKLGSYNARLTWNPAVLQYVSVVNTTFAAPTVNADSVAQGLLRFASADASGAAGQVVVARVRLRAVAAGTTSPAITITEMSGVSPTYTNLVSRVTVANGSVTVRP